METHHYQAGVLLKEYLLADPIMPCTSIICGIVACKMVYDVSQLLSAVHFKSYSNLTQMQRIEWNNRAISTFHAIFIAIVSLYLVFCSELYSDQHHGGLITFRSSPLSTFVLGVRLLCSLSFS
uniref:Transmembrane protein 56-B-like n=1 Tax=Rhizophora mucronata TaxID=61149 RepID=A0A2P2KLT7_RHIMU